MLDRVLTHLKTLVADDTSNPPRAIHAGHPVFPYAEGVLRGAGFDVRLDDLGDGSVNLLALRGAPTLLINCHLDTVPADPAWSRNPHELSVQDGRAVGLGACDIKGAAACILTAAERTTGPAAILFSSDEEGGPSRCVRAYLESPISSVEVAIVSEPTGGLGVIEHRGLATGEVEFFGDSGHSCAGARRAGSAVHHAVAWCAGAIDLFQDPDRINDNHRFNIGVIHGGTKSNMIASSAIVRFGIRPPAGALPDDPLERLQALLPGDIETKWSLRFCVPSLPRSARAGAWVDRLGIPPGPAVDFWTEAALFAQAGWPAIVFGPGDIAQAHTAGEFVELEQLRLATQHYINFFDR